MAKLQLKTSKRDLEYLFQSKPVKTPFGVGLHLPESSLLIGGCWATESQKGAQRLFPKSPSLIQLPGPLNADIDLLQIVCLLKERKKVSISGINSISTLGGSFPRLG